MENIIKDKMTLETDHNGRIVPEKGRPQEKGEGPIDTKATPLFNGKGGVTFTIHGLGPDLHMHS